MRWSEIPWNLHKGFTLQFMDYWYDHTVKCFRNIICSWSCKYLEKQQRLQFIVKNEVFLSLSAKTMKFTLFSANFALVKPSRFLNFCVNKFAARIKDFFISYQVIIFVSATGIKLSLKPVCRTKCYQLYSIGISALSFSFGRKNWLGFKQPSRKSSRGSTNPIKRRSKSQQQQKTDDHHFDILKLFTDFINKPLKLQISLPVVVAHGMSHG